MSAGSIFPTDRAQYRMRTIDVSTGGLSIAMTKLLAVRRNCHARSALEVRGQAHVVAASSHVVHCFYTSNRAYRAGLQFLSTASNGADLIGKLIAEAQPEPEE